MNDATGCDEGTTMRRRFDRTDTPRNGSVNGEQA